MKKTKICDLLEIKYPIIQGGMVWASGAKLAAAVSNQGGLGLIGAGSMKPEILKEHIQKAKSLTSKPFGVNIPLLYSRVEEQIEIALQEGVKIFFTSAGSPKKWTSYLKEKDCKVIHVISNPELAKKCELAGVDAVVAEGFEAGGHNGRDEITSFCLIPQVIKEVNIPVIAAGGIMSGAAILAAFALGAQGAQLGSRFLMTHESSSHLKYKELLLGASFNSTELSLKEHIPVRLFKNDFYNQVKKLEAQGASREELIQLLGKGRAKRGMFEGDLSQGELEIGQGISQVKEILSVRELFSKLLSEYENALREIS